MDKNMDLDTPIRLQDEDLWFGYQRSTWYTLPLNYIKIYNSKPDVAVFAVWEKDEMNSLIKSENSYRGVCLTPDALNSIEQILANHEEVFSFSQLEDPSKAGHYVLDGYKHEFVFTQSGQTVSLSGSHVEYCEGEYERCPQAAKTIDVFREIAKVLEAAGVDPDCFRL